MWRELSLHEKPLTPFCKALPLPSPRGKRVWTMLLPCAGSEGHRSEGSLAPTLADHIRTPSGPLDKVMAPEGPREVSKHRGQGCAS